MNAQNITEILDALSARFGTTGAHLWEVLVRQQILEAASYVFAIALFLTIGGPLLRAELRSENPWDEPFPYGLPALVCLAIAAVMTCVFIFEGIPSIINPEFYALKELLP